VGCGSIGDQYRFRAVAENEVLVRLRLGDQRQILAGYLVALVVESVDRLAGMFSTIRLPEYSVSTLSTLSLV